MIPNGRAWVMGMRESRGDLQIGRLGLDRGLWPRKVPDGHTYQYQQENEAG